MYNLAQAGDGITWHQHTKCREILAVRALLVFMPYALFTQHSRALGVLHPQNSLLRYVVTDALDAWRTVCEQFELWEQLP